MLHYNVNFNGVVYQWPGVHTPGTMAISVRHLANMFTTDSPRPLNAAGLNEFRGLYYLLPIVCCSKSHNKICSNLKRKRVPFGAKWSIKRTLY